MKILFCLLLAITILSASCKNNKQNDLEDLKGAEQSTVLSQVAQETGSDKDTVFSFSAFTQVVFADKGLKLEVRQNTDSFGYNIFFIVNYEGMFGDTAKAAVQRILRDKCCESKLIKMVRFFNETYLYFELYTEGGSMGNSGYDLILLDIASREEYSYRIEITPNSWYIRTFVIDCSANIYDAAFTASYLYNKLQELQSRFKFDDMEQNRYDFFIKNEEEILKYYFDNKKQIKLEFVKSKKKIFSLPSGDGTDKRIKTSTGAADYIFAENSRYIIIPYFRSGVHCYDKMTKEYFCIWSPSDFYTAPNEMFFKGTHTVDMVGTDHDISINLKTGVAKRTAITE